MYKKILKINPNDIETYYSLHLIENKYYEKGIKIIHNYPFTHLTKGFMHMR